MDAQEHLLREVVRVRRGAQVPVRQAHDPALPAAHELAERPLVAVPDGEHQGVVVVGRRVRTLGRQVRTL